MILGIDFGGTRTRAGLFSMESDGLRLIHRRETPSHVEEPVNAVIARIIDLARQTIGTAQLSAIGIAAPGPLDPVSGVIHHARTLPGWSAVPLAALIGRAFGGVPCVLHNDANLAALAEYERGAGQGCNPLVYLTISTGIGGGVVIDGRLFGGWSGLAAEPGHQIVPLADGRLVRLEDVASGTGIALQARERLAAGGVSALAQLPPDALTGAAVAAAAIAGDALAASVIDRAGAALGVGLVNLLHLFSPQAIVIGGSVAQLGDRLFDPARRVIDAYLLDAQFLPPDLIRPAQLGDDVCLIGAAWYAYRTAA